MSDFTCGACTTPNTGRDACKACDTARPQSLAATALADAGAARAVQLEETERGNHALAAHLGHVADAHLDDALALRRLGPR